MIHLRRISFVKKFIIINLRNIFGYQTQGGKFIGFEKSSQKIKSLISTYKNLSLRNTESIRLWKVICLETATNM